VDIFYTKNNNLDSRRSSVTGNRASLFAHRTGNVYCSVIFVFV